MTSFRPIIRSQRDLEDAWRRLLSPLGFAGHSLWVMVIGADDRPVPQLAQVEEAVDPPEEDRRTGLVALLREMLDAAGPGGGRLALLRSRPGVEGPGPLDRAWAQVLHATCRDAGLALDVVHLATDDDVVPLPMDDLLLAAPA